jgi:hypothetical protein
MTISRARSRDWAGRVAALERNAPPADRGAWDLQEGSGVRANGLLLLGFGAALAVLLAGFVVWAHYMFTVGPTPIMLGVVAALPGIALASIGAALVWRAQRLPRSS